MFLIAEGILEPNTQMPIGGMVFSVDDADLDNVNQECRIRSGIYASLEAKESGAAPIFTYGYAFDSLAGSLNPLAPVLALENSLAGTQPNPANAAVNQASLTHTAVASILAGATVVGPYGLSL